MTKPLALPNCSVIVWFIVLMRLPGKFISTFTPNELDEHNGVFFVVEWFFQNGFPVH